MKPITPILFVCFLLISSLPAEAKKKQSKPASKSSVKQAVKQAAKQVDKSVECNGSDDNKGQGHLVDIAYSYTYRCKSGKSEDFKFYFSYDLKKNKELKDDAIDIGEYEVKRIGDEKSLVYKIAFLKKKTFSDQVEFYIQVPNRASSVTKVVFCKNSPSLSRIDDECGDESYRIDSKDLFFKNKTVRAPSSKKSEAEDLKNLMKTVYELKSTLKINSVARN